jgi:NAD(P)-dependent dehydrogenase (short-subunit alcohol dehydrogenase family)
MATQTWFITGSSRGFGRALTVAALQEGDQVVATARKPEQLDDLVQRYGDRVLPFALDVTDRSAAVAALDAAVRRFGRIDVVVNNAGYANIAPVETTPEGDFRRQFDTNFWGVYNVSTAALPVLKAQGAGTIVQFSSVGGRVGGTAGLGSYQAAKFAVDGFTRVLAAETAPFGIRYVVVEPGGFATDWAGSSMQIHDVAPEYAATVGAVVRMLSGPVSAAGDPKRAGEILVRVVKQHTLPSHLILGASAVQMAQDYSRSQLAQAAAWEPISRSADFDQDYPVDLVDHAIPQSRSHNEVAVGHGVACLAGVSVGAGVPVAAPRRATPVHSSCAGTSSTTWCITMRPCMIESKVAATALVSASGGRFPLSRHRCANSAMCSRVSTNS